MHLKINIVWQNKKKAQKEKGEQNNQQSCHSYEYLDKFYPALFFYVETKSFILIMAHIEEEDENPHMQSEGGGEPFFYTSFFPPFSSHPIVLLPFYLSIYFSFFLQNDTFSF